MGLITLEELHERVATQVEAIDATPFDQGELAAKFRESPVPLNALVNADPLQHLAFSVLIEGAPVAQLDRDAGGTSAYLAVSVAVLFAYELLEQDEGRVGDVKLAYRAARDVAAAVMADWPHADFALDTLYRPGLVVDNYLPVRVEFTARCDVSI